jgi:L-asparaginase II
MALLAGALGRGSPAMGVAIKIADGDLGRRSDVPPGNRAATRVALKTLQDLAALDTSQAGALGEFGPQPVTNKRQLVVGWMRPCFTLERSG